MYIQQTIFLYQYFFAALSNCDMQYIYSKHQPLSLVMSGAGVLECAPINTLVFCDLSDESCIKNTAVVNYVLLHWS